MRQQRTRIGLGLLLLLAGLAAFTAAQQGPVKCPSEDVKPTGSAGGDAFTALNNCSSCGGESCLARLTFDFKRSSIGLRPDVKKSTR